MDKYEEELDNYYMIQLSNNILQD